MSAIEHSIMSRCATVSVRVGGVAIGGGTPIVVQSMTNTDTADVAGTVNQVKGLADAGSELVRITVKGEGITEEFQHIVADYVRATYGGEPAMSRLKPTAKTIAVKAVV